MAALSDQWRSNGSIGQHGADPQRAGPFQVAQEAAGVGGLRMIVPLTPKVCFATLPNRESEKRVVPHVLPADDALARRISASLLQVAEGEFISHPEFMPDQTSAPTFGLLLNEIALAIAARDNDEG